MNIPPSDKLVAWTRSVAPGRPTTWTSSGYMNVTRRPRNHGRTAAPAPAGVAAGAGLVDFVGLASTWGSMSPQEVGTSPREGSPRPEPPAAKRLRADLVAPG